MFSDHSELLSRVAAAKMASDERNRLIIDYKPYILKAAVQVVGRPLHYGSDDELSVAMMAFSEAIDRYNEEKGAFLAYTSLVIRSRINDYLRSRKYLSHEMIYDFSAQEVLEDFEQLKRMTNYFQSQGESLRRVELMELKEVLAEFGIQMKDLVGHAPKKRALRDELFECIQKVWDMEDVRKSVMIDRKLPIQTIVMHTGISPKKLDRHRKYLVLMMIIHHGDFPTLARYIDNLMKGGSV